MKCNFLSIKHSNPKIEGSPPEKSYNPSFGASTPEKLIKYILSAQNPKKVKIRFDEALKIYNHLGYDVLLKGGSHASVVLGDCNLYLVIPHKDKIIAPIDVKRLKCIIQGDIAGAKRI